jgi:phosphatidylinositol-3-phosphatase
LGSIDRIEKEKRSKDSRSNSITVVISCKDLRQQRITLQTNGLSEYILEKSIQMIAAQAFPNDKALFFAFTHSLPSEPLCLSLVEPYDAVKEFSRLGMLDVISHTGDQSLWRISIANNEYRLCNTYPKVIVVPRKISDDDLVGISNFRSGHRLPVMCWGDKDTGATMWRSSQPKAGVSGSCSVDEKMLDLIAQSCVYKKTPMGGLKVTGDPLLYIIDCRAKTSALANRASGAGYESQNNYPNTRIDFCNIGNIHVMRESLKGLTATLLSCTPMGNDVSFSKQIEDSGWLTHIRLVLKCALDTAVLIQKGLPVLVHCSHGWDRTAQICSLSQLLLDPYYRTMDGFRVLVEKEWCSFGHPFPLRSANGQDRANRQEDQISPIFLQFLDCTYQIVNQNPHYFEFNFRYLLTLSDHIHSGRFGTFLFGCDMERDTHHADQRCVNVWTYLHYNRMSFLNPLYMDPNLPNTPTTHSL